MCAFKVCEGEGIKAYWSADIVCVQGMGHMRLEMDSKIHVSEVPRACPSRQLGDFTEITP
jgi:hypothetical protein